MLSTGFASCTVSASVMTITTRDRAVDEFESKLSQSRSLTVAQQFVDRYSVVLGG
jgi:hypothetical protein